MNKEKYVNEKEVQAHLYQQASEIESYLPKASTVSASLYVVNGAYITLFEAETAYGQFRVKSRDKNPFESIIKAKKNALKKAEALSQAVGELQQPKMKAFENKHIHLH